jgi:1,4-dihydroxy-2-naphthoate octaprenyltransferase
MGVFMVVGSAFAVSGRFHWSMVPASVPVSILVSLILLANELRDFEADTRYGIRTLTVRIGYRHAILLYCVLLFSAYAGPFVLWAVGLFPRPGLVLLALPFAVPPFLFMGRPPERRAGIIPLVMLHHLAFGSLFCASYFISA